MKPTEKYNITILHGEEEQKILRCFEVTFCIVVTKMTNAKSLRENEGYCVIALKTFHHHLILQVYVPPGGVI